MSALEQGSVSPSDGLGKSDRRGAPRLRVTGSIPALIGRGDGVLVDVSARGAKIRHSTLVRRGASVRVSFEWDRARFSATAEVLASRVVSLQGTNGDTVYESRLRFTGVLPEAQNVLSRMLAVLEGRDVRRWVANLRGWSDETESVAAPKLPAVSYLRCRLFGIRWEVKCTSDMTQPEDGFLIPAGIDDNDVVRLCADYAHADEDSRRMIRLLAAAAVEETASAAIDQPRLVKSA